ncbi:hypothetical protein [Nonomuraea endophytica]|uniref:hypothetical protein n=1 Tax=Nonomuraea endophytica TaxID=714136 RepID=UPI0037C6E02C
MSAPTATRLALLSGVFLGISVMTIADLVRRPDALAPIGVTAAVTGLVTAGLLWGLVRRLRTGVAWRRPHRAGRGCDPGERLARVRITTTSARGDSTAWTWAICTCLATSIKAVLDERLGRGGGVIRLSAAAPESCTDPSKDVR